MMRGWVLVLLVGAATMLIKSAGPVLFGDRPVHPGLASVFGLLPAALFGALLATNAFARGRELVVDARLAGLVAAAVGAHLRAPAPAVIAGAVAVTAVVRLVWPGGLP